MKKLPRVSKRGYELAEKNPRAKVLLFHGYTGSPYDLRPLADFLYDHHFFVQVPLLKGHGKNPKDLLQASAKDWLQQSVDMLNGLKSDQPIILGGLSMGALIALLLSANSDAIKGLLLFSPALELNFLAKLTIASAHLGLIDKTRSPKKFGGSDILNKEAKIKTPAYQELPIAGLLEFEKLRLLALENLSRVKCPIFMAFGKFDGTIDAETSHRLILKNTSAPITSKFYSHSKHVITLDYDREFMFQDCLEFLMREIKPWC